MAKYRITAPDGNTYEINAPDDATEDQVMAYAQQNYKPAAKPSNSANNSDSAGLITGNRKPEKTFMRKVSESLAGAVGGSPAIADTLDAIQHHVMKPVHGLAQLTSHGLGLESAGRDDEALRQREESYQAHNGDSAGSYAGAAVGEVLPWMYGLGELRAAGILPTLKATKDVAGLLPKAANVAAKTGLLAGEGGLMGLVSPVTGEGDYASQKRSQVQTGAIAAPLLAAGAKGGIGAISGLGRLSRYLTPAGREAIANERVSKLFGESALPALRGAQGGPGG